MPQKSATSNSAAGTISDTYDLIGAGSAIDVRAYGAVGNGTTDDTTAIQNALAAAVKGRAKLLFPQTSGCYLISATITIPRDRNNYSMIEFQGEMAKEISKVPNPPGSCIQTTSDITAFTTPVIDTVLLDGGVDKGSVVLFSATASFTPEDRGKNITVYGAGPSGANLVTTILSFSNSTTVQLAQAASTGVTAATVIFGNDTLENWTKTISISDLYILGAKSEGYTFTPSVGLNLNGVQFFRSRNLHIEGFGYGLKILNGSEIDLQGRTLLQNNNYGAWFQRTNNTDMQLSADNLVTINNDVPLYLDNVRDLYVKSGENITYGTNCNPLCLANGNRPTPISRIHVRNSANSQLFFANYVGENDEDIPFVDVDRYGFSILVFEASNFENLKSSTLISTSGYFDELKVADSAFSRAAVGLQAPMINLMALSTRDVANRANHVVLEGNSPAWSEIAVRNDNIARNAYADVTPSGWQQVNMRPELDQAADNRIRVGGDYDFSSTSVQMGKARLFWQSGAPGTASVTVTPARPLRGVSLLFVTLITDDNHGEVVPQITTIRGIGTNPEDWQAIAYYKLGTYKVGSRIFTKYGFAVSILNKTASISTGVIAVEVGNFYTEPKGSSGVYGLNIYVKLDEVGVVQSTPRTMAAAPTTGLEGWCSVGDIIYKSNPAQTGVLGWVCTSEGKPGTWRTLDSIPPNPAQPLDVCVSPKRSQRISP